MTAFDAEKLRTSAIAPSMLASPTPNHDEKDVAATRFRRCSSNDARAAAALRDAPKRSDGQMFAPPVPLDGQLDHRAVVLERAHAAQHTAIVAATNRAGARRAAGDPESSGRMSRRARCRSGAWRSRVFAARRA